MEHHGQTWPLIQKFIENEVAENASANTLFRTNSMATKMIKKYSGECNTIQYNAIQHNTIQYNTLQYNTIQYKQNKTTQYNPIQYNTLHTI